LRDGLARTARDDGPRVSGFLSVLGVLGTLFMRALKMVVVPLVIAPLVSGMAGLGREGKFGRIGLKTFFIS
jgi:Na+/H+-dicarboxylate symporter